MMDDDKRNAQELAKLGRAIREARKRRGLSEREMPTPCAASRPPACKRLRPASAPRSTMPRSSVSHALGVAPGSLFVRAESLDAE
jgi:hypothetical protein